MVKQNLYSVGFAVNGFTHDSFYIFFNQVHLKHKTVHQLILSDYDIRTGEMYKNSEYDVIDEFDIEPVTDERGVSFSDCEEIVARNKKSYDNFNSGLLLRGEQSTVEIVRGFISLYENLTDLYTLL